LFALALKITFKLNLNVINMLQTIFPHQTYGYDQ
jgi:hypothetical protein